MKSIRAVVSARPVVSTAVSAAFTVLLAASPAQAQGNLIAKQLAGPPADFAAMRAVDPVEATVYSKSALLPLKLKADAAGQYKWQGELPVENGRLRFLVFSGDSNPWQVEMVTPSGQAKRAAGIAREVQRTEFGIDQMRHPADYYTFEGMEKGTWQLKVSSGNSSVTEGFLLLEGDPATEMASYQTHRNQLAGNRIGFAAALIDGNEKRAGANAVAKSTGHIDSVSLRVTSPGGAIETYVMFDDGRHSDGIAGDGIYGGDFPALATGRYLAQVVMRGVDRNNQPIVRTAEHVVPVVEATLQLGAVSAKATRVGDSRLSIDIPAIATMTGKHYRAYGELWGTNANGEAVAVAWIGGMVSPAPSDMAFEDRVDLRSPLRDRFDVPVAREGSAEASERGMSVISLGFDERWIALAGARAPFELRDLRIEDPDHFITVASASRMALSLPQMKVKATPGEIAVDEAMTMGPRPTISSTSLAKGTGTRLLLVHGYCSSNVWPAAQFTNASTFLDLNQNRSHDQFAQLIRNFGATWNSFGTVSHSQGGAASLHLYTYYWSGLDNATGARLMQSVGTPYQGTNLAGVLAALGGIFGAGCGTNDNLTYSGAASWLAGIPTSSRAKVNYYTTSFKSTNWWTNDYCNFASDLVLSDPEDGTTEQAYGQLPGAVNRGHTTGQCHTTGMRDPAQYLDSSRNATMNTNAAR